MQVDPIPVIAVGMDSARTRYDTIGAGYGQYRREDPRLVERLLRALGPARTVLNVGAGTGSYEPSDRLVVPLEPSKVMAAQRPDSWPAIRASAHEIPLHDDSVDAAMTILSLHHWDERQEEGIREMCRVARQRVVVLTIDAQVSNQMWLMADYLPEVAELDTRIFPTPERVAAWIGNATIEVVPIPSDTPDWTLLSFWAHPERVLDPGARAATSGFARQTQQVNERVEAAVRRDLESSAWDRKHGHLRELAEYDCGLRLIVGELESRQILQ